MMNELIEAIVERLQGELGGEFDAGVGCPDLARNPRLYALGKGLEVEVLSLGFSQTAGAGTLKPYYYLGIVLRASKMYAMGKAVVDAAAERIVNALHRERLADLNVLFSKAVRCHEKHVVQLTTRSLTLDPKDGECVEALFFYASPLTLSQLESQGATLLDANPAPQVVVINGDGIWD